MPNHWFAITVVRSWPEQVEKYLESVLHLGNIWDCVVLLDEADVFLKEREIADLARNALVSIFLSVLEYYDGILILTSNRVGTFDEAFKSRISLALLYPNFTKSQRCRISMFENQLNGSSRATLPYMEELSEPTERSEEAE
ncbi:uncharacterized protein K460DRAFT_407828 [Cucurbitaria berberidis CBS 394.84]|uniref:ATPase AAA-type core domain-containing protein n=1 Tax=Cucurbitaria berberidis CBS 394.84 TaxID=1168544 RepID=A0A9P4GE03_9PLEO|nr:uncharacterized protein K460DRAFT_407828 [Cucurbitaria berberidis CBS 394.84]KAF1843475.1 hypothetical protein K460DRAFT_407828 [Cucurbitaria berberidis CBS 394.84]